MNLQILPLAITMMAGPQIMAAIIFVTAPKALKVSVPFLAGVVIATTVGVIITTTVASQLSLGDPSDSGSSGNIIQYVLVGLLVALAVKNYVGRETVEPPSWLGTLQSADPKKALTTGLLLLYLLFYRRAQRVMPKVRDWMNTNSWLVNIIVCGVFIALILL